MYERHQSRGFVEVERPLSRTIDVRMRRRHPAWLLAAVRAIGVVVALLSLGACFSQRDRAAGTDPRAASPPSTTAGTLGTVETLTRNEPSLRALVAARKDGFAIDIEENAPARYVSAGWRSTKSQRFSDLGVRLPADAAGHLQVGVSRFQKLRLEIVLVGASRTSTAHEDGGRVVYLDAFTETDRVLAGSESTLEELLVLKSASAPKSFTWQITLPEGIPTAREREGGIDFVDDTGRVALRVSPPFAIDANGDRHASPLAWDAARRAMRIDVPTGLTYPVVLDPTFQPAVWIKTLEPPGRSEATMVFDAARGELVMFAGAGQGDTWRRRGGAWIEAVPGTSPTPRSNYGMTYDAKRGEVILFGGYGTSGVLNDTWRWDGLNWTKLSPATSPSPRYGQAMAFDPIRNEVVLYGGRTNGGAFGETWIWNGTTWRNANAAFGTRSSLGLAFDVARGEMIAFGGDSGAEYNDTWRWNGTVWTKANPATSPSSRSGFGMTYDAGRSEIIIFGCFQNNETWRWNGTTWALAPAASSPVTRYGPAMAYDPLRDEVVIHGGLIGGATRAAETYAWKGTTWNRVTPASPPQVYDAAMAFDAARSEVILFGGFDEGPEAPVDGTWRWNGTAWSDAAPATSPPARARHRMVYDAARSEILMFGGSGATVVLDDTWRWNGTTWTPVDGLATKPDARTRHGMAYDAARSEVILFGGVSAGNTTIFADTWRWNGSSWTKANPAASPSARYAPGMTYDVARGETLLFGGIANALASDTWRWNGTTWTEAKPPASPTARYDSALSYDAARKTVVSFGGYGNGATPDTWAWDGLTWRIDAPTMPSDLYSTVAAAYDPVRRAHVAFAGSKTYLYVVYGGGCAANTDCRGGACVDGVCCSTSSCNTCETCAGPTLGECTSVLNTEDPDTCAVAQGKSCSAGGVCKAGPGSPAANAIDCASGFLVDGVCCDSKCDGKCMACRADLKESGTRSGVCDFARAGTDLRESCATEPAATCQHDGTCDGRGGCRLYTSGVGCGAVSCVDNRAAGRICTGLGQCADSPQGIPCGAYACVIDAGCKSSCTTNEDCGPVHKCELPKTPASGASGVCVPTGANTCLNEHQVKRFDGSLEECGFSKCRDGACIARCASLADCVYPNDCAPDGRCVGFSPDPAVDLGACAFGGAGGTRGNVMLCSVGVLAMIALLRSRRRSSTSVPARSGEPSPRA